MGWTIKLDNGHKYPATYEVETEIVPEGWRVPQIPHVEIRSGSIPYRTDFDKSQVVINIPHEVIIQIAQDLGLT